MTTTRSLALHIREPFSIGTRSIATCRRSLTAVRDARITRALAVAAGIALFFTVAVVDGLRSAAYRRRTRRTVAR